MSFLKTPDLPESFTKLISNCLQWFDRAFNFSDYPTKVQLIYVGGEILIWGFPYFWPKAFTQIIFRQIVANKIKLNFLFKFCISEFRFCINLGLSELSLNNPAHRFNFVCGTSDQKNEYA